MAKLDYDGPILEIDQLSISFFTRLREIPAVMDFSCVVQPGEAMGLVGESGCGKSTVALGVMQDLGVNGRIVGGSIKFKGRDLSTMSAAELRDIRGNEIAMIYQEPMASFAPASDALSTPGWSEKGSTRWSRRTYGSGARPSWTTWWIRSSENGCSRRPCT